MSETRATYHACTPPRRNALAPAAQQAANLRTASYALDGLLDVLSKRLEAAIDDAQAQDLAEHLDKAWLAIQGLSRELDPFLSYRVPVLLPCPETEEVGG